MYVSLRALPSLLTSQTRTQAAQPLKRPLRELDANVLNNRAESSQVTPKRRRRNADPVAVYRRRGIHEEDTPEIAE